jgi:hypothetical protein
MITINDILFSEGCCGGHVFTSEYIRSDKIGFFIHRKGDEETYTVDKYGTDGRTRLETKTELTTEELIEYLNK